MVTEALAILLYAHMCTCIPCFVLNLKHVALLVEFVEFVVELLNAFCISSTYFMIRNTPCKFNFSAKTSNGLLNVMHTLHRL